MKPIDRPHQYLNLKTSAEVGNDVDCGAKIQVTWGGITIFLLGFPHK